jgi:hypothetical protein
MQWTVGIRDGTLIEKDVWRFLSIIFDLKRTHQLNRLPDRDLVDLRPPIEPYQVTKSQGNSRLKLGVISDFITPSQPQSVLVFRWDAYRHLFIHLYKLRRC